MGADHVIIAGRFEVGPLIGVGATGSVYLGVDTLTGEQVAIKALRRELTGCMPDLVERFRREGQLPIRASCCPDHPQLLLRPEQGFPGRGGRFHRKRGFTGKIIQTLQGEGVDYES